MCGGGYLHGAHAVGNGNTMGHGGKGNVSEEEVSDIHSTNQLIIRHRQCNPSPPPPPRSKLRIDRAPCCVGKAQRARGMCQHQHTCECKPWHA